jgi:hypothetical protein
MWNTLYDVTPDKVVKHILKIPLKIISKVVPLFLEQIIINLEFLVANPFLFTPPILLNFFSK